MSKGTATIIVGIAVGFIGVLVYNELRGPAVDEDAEALIDRLSRQLRELEKSPQPQAAAEV